MKGIELSFKIEGIINSSIPVNMIMEGLKEIAIKIPNTFDSYNINVTLMDRNKNQISFRRVY